MQKASMTLRAPTADVGPVDRHILCILKLSMTLRAHTADVGPVDTDVVNTEGVFDPESSYS